MMAVHSRLSTRRGRFRLLAALTTLLAVSGFIASPTANAAVTDDAGTTSCSLNLVYPGASDDVPGDIDDYGTVTCDGVVASVYITMELFYNGQDYAWNQDYATGVRTDTVDAATPCLPGSYYGKMIYTIYFGPTASPNTTHGTIRTPVVALTC